MAELKTKLQDGSAREYSGINRNQFDVMATNVPFGRDKDGAFQDTRFLESMLENLERGGRCACIMSGGFLGRNNKEDVKLRKRIITEFNLRCIILLPPDIFYKAKVYSALLLIVNEPPDQQPVKMVDLRSREVTEGVKADVQEIVKGTTKNLDASCEYVSKREIEQRLYYLSPDLYIKVPRQVLWKKLHRQAQFGLFIDSEKSVLLEVDKMFREFILKGQYEMKKGNVLFRVKGGEKVPKHGQQGIYTLYKGDGLAHSFSEINVAQGFPTIVINRLGNYCGQVFIAKEPCFVADSAMYICGYYEPFDIIFLYFLFRSKDLNNKKNRSTVPYIHQGVILEEMFAVPPLEEQQRFSNEAWERMTRILGFHYKLQNRIAGGNTYG